MHVILRGRQLGKTTELIRLAAEKYAYIVCADKQQAINLWQRVREMGLMGKVPFPLTWAEFAERRYGPGVESILIDDLDACLQAMTRLPILAVSINDTSSEARATLPPGHSVTVSGATGVQLGNGCTQVNNF